MINWKGYSSTLKASFYIVALVFVILSCGYLLSLIVDVPTIGYPLLAFSDVSNSAFPFIFTGFFFVTLSVPIFFIILRKKRLECTTVESEVPQSNSSFLLKLVLIFSVVLMVFLMLERYLWHPYPTGGDVAYYMISFNDISNHGVSISWLSRMTSTRIFSTVFSPLLFLNLSSDVIVKIIPSLIGALYTLATYFFFKNTNKQLSVLAALATGLSSTILVLSSQLYENFFALVILTLFFGLYLRSLDGGKLKYVMLASICQFFLLQVYNPAWLVSTGIISVFTVISLLTSQNKLRLLKTTFIVYLPSILVLLIGPFVFSQIWDYNVQVGALTSTYSPSINNVGAFIPSVFAGSSGGFDFQLFLMENSFVLLLSMVGVIALLFRFSKLRISQNARTLLLAWAFTPSFMLPLFSYGHYRYALYYPIPLLISISLFLFVGVFINFDKLNLKFRKFLTLLSPIIISKKLKKFLPLICIFTILLSYSFIRLVDSPLIYVSFKDYADELYWVRENFEPSTTIVCIGDSVYNPPIVYEGEVAWVQAITEAYIHVGTLADLLNGTPKNVSYPWVNTPPVLNSSNYNDFRVLVISRSWQPFFYSINSLEEPILKEVHSDVFELKNMTISQENAWLTSWFKSAATNSSLT